MTLEPQEQFTIVRQLADHTDPNTYYVRASVREAKTDKLLARIPLVNRGENRYSQNWQVIADMSGLGTYISITTEVFINSSYATKSNNYGDEIQTYKVMNTRRSGGGSGGAGADVDYKKIRTMIEEVVSDIKFPETKEVSFDKVLSAIDKLSNTVKSIKIPEFPTIPKVDIQSVVKQIKTLENSILKGIGDIPGRDKNDILPLAEAVEKIDVESINTTVKSAVQDFFKIMDGLEKFSESIPELQEKLQNIEQDFKDILYGMNVAGVGGRTMIKPKEEKPQVDPRIARIASKLSKRQ